VIGLAFEKGGSATAVDQTCCTEVISNSCALNLSQDVDLFLGHHLLLHNYILSTAILCIFNVLSCARFIYEHNINVLCLGLGRGTGISLRRRARPHGWYLSHPKEVSRY